MSAFCSLCTKGTDTGEYFCARLGVWVEKCPNFPDGYPWAAEKETREEGDEEWY